MADGPNAGVKKRIAIDAEPTLGRQPDPTLALESIAPALSVEPTLNRSNRRPIRTQDAIIAQGVYLAENGSYSYAEINRVKILPIHDLHAACRFDSLSRDIVRMCSDLSIDRVMIADTMPSNRITSLITALVRSGVKVEFVDHHAGDYMHKPDKRGYQHNHKLLHDLLDPMQGHRFVSTDRDEAASVAQLIPQGDLVKRGVGLYISAPPDADGIFSGIRGAGIDMSRTDEFNANCFDTVTALGLRDSPHSQPSQDAKRERQGRSEPEWLREFYSYHGYLKGDSGRMVKGILGMALCAKEGKLLDGIGDDALREVRAGAGARMVAIDLLVNNYYDETHFADKKIYILDLASVGTGSNIPLDQVFKSQEELGTAEELIGEGPGRIDTQELRKPIEHLMKTMHEDRCVLVVIREGQERIGKSVEITGVGDYYQKNQGDDGINFLGLGRRLGMKVGGLIGHRAHVNLGVNPVEQEANFSKIISVLGDMVKEADRRQFRPYPPK